MSCTRLCTPEAPVGRAPAKSGRGCSSGHVLICSASGCWARWVAGLQVWGNQPPEVLQAGTPGLLCREGLHVRVHAWVCPCGLHTMCPRVSAGHWDSTGIPSSPDSGGLSVRWCVDTCLSSQEMLKYSKSCEGAEDLQEALSSILGILKAVNDSMHLIAITGYDVRTLQRRQNLEPGAAHPWHCATELPCASVSPGVCRAALTWGPGVAPDEQAPSLQAAGPACAEQARMLHPEAHLCIDTAPKPWRQAFAHVGIVLLPHRRRVAQCSSPLSACCGRVHGPVGAAAGLLCPPLRSCLTDVFAHISPFSAHSQVF